MVAESAAPASLQSARNLAARGGEETLALGLVGLFGESLI